MHTPLTLYASCTYCETMESLRQLHTQTQPGQYCLHNIIPCFGVCSSVKHVIVPPPQHGRCCCTRTKQACMHAFNSFSHTRQVPRCHGVTVMTFTSYSDIVKYPKAQRLGNGTAVIVRNSCVGSLYEDVGAKRT